MKALGIVRKIDDLGRITIPKEVRNQKGWDAGQPVEMFMNDEQQIVIGAYKTDSDKERVLENLESLKLDADQEESQILDEAIRAIRKGGE
ncbi:AbrB/MazE/SpoVT family DNA-binding domain-containing protein [Salibacterium salarium]|uniref:AbrB/MazE/SpoVT family DNA-binding domain-containing protein n=1 Tax=Salibacterium salarium TaxID=284579 RepID=A0A428N2H1_9BACI|nr:AbrB/MazE/SpoVT family DNA-binding domain-containing protein [Salibacterium salarium]RSL32641.1 AbrB/MazE/SpoVT family DNA-binding domain-containing protein [Salibacterium salarium]